MKRRTKLVIYAAVALVFIGVLLAISSPRRPNLDGQSGASKRGAYKKSAVVVGMSGGYKPYTFLNEDGDLVGFEVDLWNKIGEKIEKPVEFQTAAFSGLFGMLDSGKIDTIANQITITPERLLKYQFSRPYVYYGAQLVVREADESITGLSDLVGKRVGVSLGSNYESMVREADPEGKIDVVTYEDYQGSLQDVALGRLDAVLNDRLAALTTISESGLALKFGGEPVQWLSNAYPFVEGNAELAALVDEALEELEASGELEEISLQWFGADITSR